MSGSCSDSDNNNNFDLSQSLVATRARRANAGNRLRVLLDAEEPLEDDDIFLEVENDQDFDFEKEERKRKRRKLMKAKRQQKKNSTATTDAENEGDSIKPLKSGTKTAGTEKDVNASTSDIGEEVSGNDDEGEDGESGDDLGLDSDVFSDSESSSDDDKEDEDVGEKELQRIEKERKRQQVKRDKKNYENPIIARAKRQERERQKRHEKEQLKEAAADETDNLDALKNKRPRLLASDLMRQERRQSTRTASKKNRNEVIQRLEESEARRAKYVAPVRKVIHKITQAERLEEAKITEQRNLDSLKQFFQQEEERKQRQRAAMLAKRIPMKSFVRYLSTTKFIPPTLLKTQPLIAEIPEKISSLEIKKNKNISANSSGVVLADIQSTDSSKIEEDNIDVHATRTDDKETILPNKTNALGDDKNSNETVLKVETIENSLGEPLNTDAGGENLSASDVELGAEIKGSTKDLCSSMDNKLEASITFSPMADSKNVSSTVDHSDTEMSDTDITVSDDTSRDQTEHDETKQDLMDVDLDENNRDESMAAFGIEENLIPGNTIHNGVSPSAVGINDESNASGAEIEYNNPDSLTENVVDNDVSIGEKTSNTDEEVGENGEQVSETDRQISEAAGQRSDTDEKIDDTDEKVGDTDENVGDTDQKVNVSESAVSATTVKSVTIITPEEENDARNKALESQETQDSCEASGNMDVEGVKGELVPEVKSSEIISDINTDRSASLPETCVEGPVECVAYTTISLLQFPQESDCSISNVRNILFGPQGVRTSPIISRQYNEPRIGSGSEVNMNNDLFNGNGRSKGKLLSKQPQSYPQQLLRQGQQPQQSEQDGQGRGQQSQMASSFQSAQHASSLQLVSSPGSNLCIITGQKSKFRDPKLGNLPYSSLKAYKIIERVQKGEYNWNLDLGGVYDGLRKGQVHAKGVPPGFDD